MQETAREGSALRSPVAWARFLAIALAGAALDLVTKYWAYYALRHEGTRWSAEAVERLQRRLLCIHLDWRPNEGAVFGVGQGQTATFIVFTFLALALLTWLFADSRRNQIWFQVFLACVAAGALGNLHDRIRFGEVHDWMQLTFRAGWATTWGGKEGYVWPWVFNVADVFISVGVSGLFIVWLVALIKHHRGESAKTSGAA